MTTSRIVTLIGAGVAVLAVVLLAVLGDYPADSAINVILGVLGGAGILGAATGPSVKAPADEGGRVDLGALFALAALVAAVLLTVVGLAAVYGSMGCAHSYTARAGAVTITKTPDCAAVVQASGDGDPEIVRVCIEELVEPVSLDPAVLLPTCEALLGGKGD